MDVISEKDIELLEALLDGELPSQERAALEQRFAVEAELAEEYRAARAIRTMRVDAFESLEGDDAAVARVVQQVRRHAHGAPVRAAGMGYMRRLLVGAGAAACIGLGFLVGAGWMGSLNKSNEATAATSCEVQIRDAEGNLVAVQKFDSEEKARQFSEHLRQWQERQERLMNGDVTVKTASF